MNVRNYSTVANKAFPKEQYVIDHIRSIHGFREQDLTQSLSDGVRRELQQFIKGLKILYMEQIPTGKRIYRVNGLGVPPREHK